MAIFTNQARLTYNGQSVNSNVTTGEIIEVLSMSKVALDDSYRVGDTIVYAVSILNAGTADFQGLALLDDLGGYDFGGSTLYPLSYVDGSLKYYVNGVLQATPVLSAGPPLNISGITVPAGGNAMLLYEVEVGELAPPSEGSLITNTATLSGGGLSTPVTASAQIGADGSARLSITKSLSPSSVAENGRLTYTFVIENSGSQATVAIDDLTLIDIFDPVLSDLTVTLDGVPFTAYSYDQASGTFTTTPGSITVPGATFVQDPLNGQWQTDPGAVVLVVSGQV
ncbi:MAG: hypothetical protein J6M12_01980 [Clostridia bacterium]|nr:hypothetical protein [Clostridia bacterium]